MSRHWQQEDWGQTEGEREEEEGQEEEREGEGEGDHQEARGDGEEVLWEDGGWGQVRYQL